MVVKISIKNDATKTVSCHIVTRRLVIFYYCLIIKLLNCEKMVIIFIFQKTIVKRQLLKCSKKSKYSDFLEHFNQDE